MDGACLPRGLTACLGKTPWQQGCGRSQARRWERFGTTLHLLMQTPAPQSSVPPCPQAGTAGGQTLGVSTACPCHIPVLFPLPV